MDIEKVDSMFTFFARCLGTLWIGMAFMSARAVNFLRTSDKEAVIVSHWLVSTCVLISYHKMFNLFFSNLLTFEVE